MEFSGDIKLFRKRAGVYMIVCLSSGKVYIGSSYDLSYRYTQHLSGLRRGKHHSRYMLRSWIKYGPEQFVFHVLELCPVDKRLEREQWYLDTFRPYDPIVGFNNARTAESNAGFIFPESAKETLRQKALGRKKTPEAIENNRRAWKENHVQWTQDSIDRRGVEFDIKSPTGIIIHVKGLKRFAKEHGLDHSQLKRLRDGKHNEVKGWTLPHINLPKAKTLIGPEGQEVTIPRKQTKMFCRERGLDPCMVYQVLRGVRQTHRGWRLPDPITEPKE